MYQVSIKKTNCNLPVRLSLCFLGVVSVSPVPLALLSASEAAAPSPVSAAEPAGVKEKGSDSHIFSKTQSYLKVQCCLSTSQVKCAS